MLQNTQRPSVTLPFQATRGKTAPLVALSIVAGFFLGAGAVFLTFPRTTPPGASISSQTLLYFLIAGFAVLSLIFLAVLLLLAKPAYVRIDKTSITIKPMPVLGFTYGKQVTLNTADFAHIEIRQGNTNQGSPLSVILRSKDNKTRVELDAPKEMQPHDFAESLSAALNLEIKNA